KEMPPFPACNTDARKSRARRSRVCAGSVAVQAVASRGCRSVDSCRRCHVGADLTAAYGGHIVTAIHRALPGKSLLDGLRQRPARSPGKHVACGGAVEAQQSGFVRMPGTRFGFDAGAVA